MIIRDVIDSVTLEAREELQKMVPAKPERITTAQTSSRLCRKRLLVEHLVARMSSSCPPVEVTRVQNMVGLTAEEEALIKKLRGDK